jgi:hypothetical protein
MAAAYDMLDRMEAVLDKLTEDYAACEQTTHELRNEIKRMHMRPLTDRICDTMGEVRDVVSDSMRSRAESWLGNSYEGSMATVRRRTRRRGAGKKLKSKAKPKSTKKRRRATRRDTRGMR